MAKRKRKKITDEEIRGWFSPEFWESHERADRLLTERLAYYDRKIEGEAARRRRRIEPF